MTFILVPKRGEDIQVNGWNWRPTLELLLEEKLISFENYERMGAQAAGGHVSAETAERIADVIERKLMAGLNCYSGAKDEMGHHTGN